MFHRNTDLLVDVTSLVVANSLEKESCNSARSVQGRPRDESKRLLQNWKAYYNNRFDSRMELEITMRNVNIPVLVTRQPGATNSGGKSYFIYASKMWT